MKSKLSASMVQNNKTVIIKVGILLVSTILVYSQDLSIVFGKALDLSAGNISNYVIVIPFLVAYIVYRKRKILSVSISLQDRQRNTVRLEDIIGIALCLVAIVMYLYGSSTLYALEYAIFSIPIFVAGATMLLFNIKTFRHAIFAIVLLVYLQPPPAEFVGELAGDLSWAMAVMVQGVLSTAGMHISLQADYGAPALLVEKADGSKIPFFVGEPSSGVYSTIGLSLFALFVAYIIRGPLWKRGILFAAGFPVFFLLNMLRIVTIVSLWYTSGQNVAESFHVVSGSMMVAIGTMIILLFGEKVLRVNIRSRRLQKEECPECKKSLGMGESLCLFCGMFLKHLTLNFDRKSISRIAIFVVITALVTVSQIPVNPPASATGPSNIDIKSIEGPETTRVFLPAIDGWDLKYAYRDARIESVLRQDASLAYMYSANSSSTITVARTTVFTAVQVSTGHHTWESSMVIYPSRFDRPTATVIALQDVDITQNQKGRLFIYQRPGSSQTEAVVYWDYRLPLRFGSGIESRNVQIILWVYTDTLAKAGLISGPDDVTGIETLLFSLARPISAYWDDSFVNVRQQTSVDTVIYQHPHVLVAAIIFPTSIVSARYQIKRTSLRHANERVYNHLTSSDEKLMIKAMLDNTLNGKLTGESIAEAYRKLTGATISESKLVEMLELARNAGLISTEVSTDGDEPILIWKPNLELKTDEPHS